MKLSLFQEEVGWRLDTHRCNHHSSNHTPGTFCYVSSIAGTPFKPTNANESYEGNDKRQLLTQGRQLSILVNSQATPNKRAINFLLYVRKSARSACEQHDVLSISHYKLSINVASTFYQNIQQTNQVETINSMQLRVKGRKVHLKFDDALQSCLWLCNFQTATRICLLNAMEEYDSESSDTTWKLTLYAHTQ